MVGTWGGYHIYIYIDMYIYIHTYVCVFTGIYIHTNIYILRNALDLSDRPSEVRLQDVLPYRKPSQELAVGSSEEGVL